MTTNAVCTHAFTWGCVWGGIKDIFRKTGKLQTGLFMTCFYNTMFNFLDDKKLTQCSISYDKSLVDIEEKVLFRRCRLKYSRVKEVS